MNVKSKPESKPDMTAEEKFLGAVWTALNNSRTHEEIWEVMTVLNADRLASRMNEKYFRSKTKSKRIISLEYIDWYRSRT